MLSKLLDLYFEHRTTLSKENYQTLKEDPPNTAKILDVFNAHESLSGENILKLIQLLHEERETFEIRSEPNEDSPHIAPRNIRKTERNIQPKALSNRVKRRIKALGLTQSQASSLLKLPPHALYYYNYNLKVQKLEEIEKIINTVDFEETAKEYRELLVKCQNLWEQLHLESDDYERIMNINPSDILTNGTLQNLKTFHDYLTMNTSAINAKRFIELVKCINAAPFQSSNKHALYYFPNNWLTLIEDAKNPPRLGGLEFILQLPNGYYKEPNTHSQRYSDVQCTENFEEAKVLDIDSALRFQNGAIESENLSTAVFLKVTE